MDERRRLFFILLLLLALALLPGLALLLDEPFLLVLATRVLIYGLAAASLDLLIGYGGLVSFGHAAYLGVGAYVAGILAHHAAEGGSVLGLPGTAEALIAWPAAMTVSGLVALALGALALRTSGVHFIMITLAFAQMLFFFFVSLERYGGDDGLILIGPGTLAGLPLKDDTAFYYVCLACLAGFLLFAHRLVNARFGMVLQGARQNEARMAALGFRVFRYRLAAFALAGAVAGLAGALSAAHTAFVSPDLIAWTKSGELMIMVILGGQGSLAGPVIGAAALLTLETALGAVTEHWMLWLGPILIAAVLFTRGGIAGVLLRAMPAMRREPPAPPPSRER